MMPDTYVHPDGREFQACSVSTPTDYRFLLVHEKHVFVPMDTVFIRKDTDWRKFFEDNEWHVRLGQ